MKVLAIAILTLCIYSGCAKSPTSPLSKAGLVVDSPVRAAQMPFRFDELTPEHEKLNDMEQSMLEAAKLPSQAVPRANIVLIWPNDWSPAWEPESKVTSPAQMAQWLDRAYAFLRHWFEFDPNSFYEGENGVRDRLVFVMNGKDDFNFGYQRRPSIGLRDGTNPVSGVADWFGWIAHEMTHDFIHNHPDLRKEKARWGEGLCDYMRFQVQIALNMEKAAVANYETYMKAPYSNRYHGGARLLLEFQERTLGASATTPFDLAGPREVLRLLRQNGFSEMLLRAPWEFEK